MERFKLRNEKGRGKNRRGNDKQKRTCVNLVDDFYKKCIPAKRQTKEKIPRILNGNSEEMAKSRFIDFWFWSS